MLTLSPLLSESGSALLGGEPSPAASPSSSPVEVEHGCARSREPLVPMLCKVQSVVDQTSDVKEIRVTAPDGTKPFEVKPGQTAMLSVIPYGECMFCVSSQGDDYLEFTVKRVGFVTEQLHALEAGDVVGLRGPYGNWFPYEQLVGRDVLFIGGGIGLAPLRSLITYMLAHRSDYGRIDLVYSGSTKNDLVYYEDIKNVWPKIDNVHVHLSVYRESPDWAGEVCYTAPFLESLGFTADGRVVVLCGGPSLFNTCLGSLERLGFAAADIITTLEMKMKCGIGKCGRCNIGSKYICLDGPVFTLEELRTLPGSVH